MNNNLKILAAMYFIIEVIINYSLYRQLSVSSNVFAAGSLEMWGKIVIGLGAALLVVQVLSLKGFKIRNNEIITFLFVCIATIPLSFIAQEKIVEEIVDSADKAIINNSILVVATKSTLVPHYNYAMARYLNERIGSKELWKITYPFSFGENPRLAVDDYYKNQNNFSVISSECKTNSENVLGVSKNIDKAFFAYNLIRNQSSINEKKYKQVISEFYNCLYEDPYYRSMNIKGIENNGWNAIKAQHSAYVELSTKYKSYMEKAVEADDDEAISKINREWRKQINEAIGFKTDIGPDLSDIEFTEHPDVIRAFYIKGGKDAVWPIGEEWDNYVIKTVADLLPDIVILGYRNNDDTIIYPVFDQVRVDGKEAYKSIIMPIVGLGLSAFFLVFNLITISTSVLMRYSKVGAIVYFVSAISWAILWPNQHLLSHDKNVSKSDVVLNIVYYHESNLAIIYDNLFFKVQDFKSKHTTKNLPEPLTGPFIINLL